MLKSDNVGTIFHIFLKIICYGYLFEPRYEKNFFFCNCEHKDTDQVRSNCAADQRLSFRYTDSTIFLLYVPKFAISSHQPFRGRFHEQCFFAKFGSSKKKYAGVNSRGLNVKHFYNGVVQVQDHFRYGFVEIDM